MGNLLPLRAGAIRAKRRAAKASQFVDMADIDTEDDGNAFTKEERFTLDYTQPAGRERRYAVAYTLVMYRIKNLKQGGLGLVE